MKRRIGIGIVLLVLCFVTGCAADSGETGGQESSGIAEESGESVPTQESHKEDETGEEPEQTREPDAGKEDEPAETQVSDTELRKLELTLESHWNTYVKLREQAEMYDRMENGVSEDDMKALVRGEILRCYEENTLLAVEIKTLVMGSVGARVPTGFSTGEDVMKSYGGYVEDTLKSLVNVQGVIDEIASPEVQEVLKNGFDGAMEAYQDRGDLEDILQGAVSSIAGGVKAKVQEEVKAYATGILDETTGGLYSTFQEMAQYDSLHDYLASKADAGEGGLVESLEGITSYDSTPGALLQDVTNTAGSSVAEIKNFLERETITSGDISEMMYQFSQFGYAMQTLSHYGASVSFSWKENYDKMETLYKRFLRNELMIQMLGDKGSVADPVIQEQLVSGTGSSGAGMDYLYEKPGLTPEEESKDNEARYEILSARLEELKGKIEEAQNRVDNVPEMFASLERYRNQMGEVNGRCDRILDYSVKNFEAAYDDLGIEKMRQLNTINNAVGEIAKWTPYGVVINLFSSMNIAGSDAYYSSMTSANEAFAKAYQRVVLETREALASLEVVLDFYNELTEETEDAGTEYDHLNLLRYLLDDGDIDISQSEREVKELLYLLAAETDAMSKIYGAIYTDNSAANTYKAQYEEIMAVIDPQGTGEAAALVTTEKLAEYLLPVVQAGVGAIRNVEGIVDAPNQDNKFVDVYRSNGVPGGKIWCQFINLDLVHVTHQDSWIDIYYSGGEPLCIDGYYFYNRIALNGGENVDADTACQEAVWIWENIWHNQQGFRDTCKVRVGNMKAALGET